MNTISRDSATIRAARIHSFGGPEVLHVENVPPREPASDEILVRVHAAGVNPIDWQVREGSCGPLPLPRTLGCDLSGVVEALGPGVTDFFAGQSVFGHSSSGGAFAELCVAHVAGMAAKPPALDDIEAAATPLCALTAWQALFTRADLQPGQTILIHGAGGGVGLFAAQLALCKGAWVIATASSRSAPLLRQLGVHQIIDYANTRFEHLVERVDVVLDLVGGTTQQRSWNIIKTGGCLVSTISAPCQEIALLRGVDAWKMQTRPRSDELTMIADLIANGDIKVMVDKVLPLSHASQALEISRRGHARGRIVLTVERG